MAKVSSFVGTMPNGRVLHVFMMTCCQKYIPFHYDPATKVFSAYPVCQEDLDEMQAYYNFINLQNNGVFNSNPNR